MFFLRCNHFVNENCLIKTAQLKNVQQFEKIVDLSVIKGERPFNGPINNSCLKRVASASKFILSIKNNNKENGKINLITPVLNVLIRFFH